MASTASPNLKLELIGTGEQQGTWGATTNTNLGTLLEEAIGGFATVAMADADQTLTMTPYTSATARNMTLEFTGALTADRTVSLAAALEKVYVVKNSTTGGFSVTFKVTGQTGVVIPPGVTTFLYADNTDVRQAVTGFGGTGAIFLPVGTTAQRPTAYSGLIRFNTTTNKFEGYTSSAWGSIGGGATGNGTDQIFIENGQTVTGDYTITTSFNAGTFGPIAINSGVTVTVPSGSTWSIV